MKNQRHQQHHEAVDGLLNLFTKANHDLTLVQHRLEKEFQQIYPHNVSSPIYRIFFPFFIVFNLFWFARKWIKSKEELNLKYFI